MLQKIRDTKGIGRHIFVGLVVAIFALWGVSSIVQSIFVNTTLAVVNGEEITQDEVSEAYQRQYQRIAVDMGENFDPDAIDEDMVLDLTINELIQRKLVAQSALSTGMVMSEDTIDRIIATTPEFQVNGSFSPERAQITLNNSGYTLKGFRTDLNRDRLIRQVLSGYAGSSFATPYELEQIARVAEQTRDIRYLVLDYLDQSMEVEVTEEEITEYYEQNQDSYIRDEQVSVDYIMLTREDIMEEIEVTDEEISARYEEQRLEVEAQTERKASHILLAANDQAAIDEALVLAADIKARIDAGESFEDLAAEYSDDGSSAAYGGDIGYTTGSTFPEPVEEALKSLMVDEVAEPVVSDFGVHIVKLTELNSVEIEPFEELAEQIRADLQEERSDTLFNERVEEMANLAFESFDLEAPAEELGLEIMTTELFSRQGGTGIAASAPFVNAAFTLEVLEDDLNSELITVNENIAAVVHLNEYHPPEVRPLDEVRVQVELEIRQQKVTEMVENQGIELLAAIQAGEDISAQLEALELSWSEREDVARDSEELTPELRAWLFSLPAPAENETVIEGTLLNDSVYVVAEILDSKPGTIEDLEDVEVESLKAYITEQTGTDDRANLMVHLQNSAEISRND